MTEANESTPPKTESLAEQDNLPKVLSTDQLFGGAREICIEHAGEKYRLRITRRNKLILQK